MTKRGAAYLLAGALIGAVLLGVARAEEITVTISGSGGTLADVIKTTFEEPFTKATGIKVKAVATTNRVSALRAMKATGKALWDSTELSGSDLAQAVKAGYVQPMDWSIVDPTNKMPAIARHKYGLATATYTTILAIRTDKVPSGRQMKSWADFWDVKGFPGPRALQNKPQDNLEFALLADGVPIDKIYDVLSTDGGLDRAFRKLDEIKPHIVSWWTAGAQPVQMLTSAEAFFTSAWNGRITKLAADGVPVTMSWVGGAMKLSYQAIPVGARYPKEAQRYLAFTISDPKRTAEYLKVMPYPGFTPGIYDHQPASAAKDMPTYPANAKVQFQTNDEFWAERELALIERWQAWLLKK
jgi:putative spermidine/putrescine transport system substrate-binding protein